MGNLNYKCGDVTEIGDIKQNCFDRIQGRAIAYHYTSDEIFADLAAAQVSANWDTVQTGTPPLLDVTPQICSNLNLIDAEAIKEGTDGAYDTAGGIEEVTGQTKPKLQFDLKFLSAANNTLINKINGMQKIGVSVFILDPDTDTGIGIQNADGSISGFPIVPGSGYISTGGGESGAVTIKKFDGSIYPDFDEKIVFFSITGKTIQELLNENAA